MNKRTAKRIAHKIAYRFLQQALDGGGFEAMDEYNHPDEDAQQKIDLALDDLTQRHFELSKFATAPPATEEGR